MDHGSRRRFQLLSGEPRPQKKTKMYKNHVAEIIFYVTSIKTILNHFREVLHLVSLVLSSVITRNIFLRRAFPLKIDHPPHDYLSVGSSLNITTLASRRVDADLSFVT